MSGCNPFAQKADTRPQKGWWAPGNYLNTCDVCGCKFIGDKRAGWCADCAYDEEKLNTRYNTEVKHETK